MRGANGAAGMPGRDGSPGKLIFIDFLRKNINLSFLGTPGDFGPPGPIGNGKF